MTPQNTASVLADFETSSQNTSSSVPEGCVEVTFSRMEYLPWNNSDNIVKEEVETYTRKVRFGILQVLFLIGGPGNVINMAVFYKQGLKDRVNLLLFFLSLADEFYLLTALLMYSEDFYLQFAAGGKAGPVLTFFINNHLGFFQAMCFVSFVLSAIIACERCYCVLRPLKYQTLIRTRTMAVIIVAVYVVVLGLFALYTFRYYFACVYDRDSGVATVVLSHSEFYKSHKDLVDYVDIVVFGSGLPAVVTVVVVTATVITASTLRKTMAWRAETTSSLSPKEVALTKMLVGTSVLLIVCVFPSCLFRVACLFLPDMNTGRRNQNFYLTCLWISHVFLYVNSTFNIVVYYVMGSRYRKTFWALFRRGAEREENGK